MVWYGMVWYGMVWYGWYGMGWYGMASMLSCVKPTALVSFAPHAYSAGVMQ